MTFDEKVYDKILQINSQEGETVALEEAVMAQGNVETWLADLLRVTRKSVHSVIRSAAITIQDPQFNLLEFENMFPAQVFPLRNYFESKCVLFRSKIEEGDSDQYCFWSPKQGSKTQIIQFSGIRKNCGQPEIYSQFPAPFSHW